MDKYAKRLEITELIADLDSYMVSVGYAETTMGNFRKAWRALKNHAQRNGIRYLTKGAADELLKNHYNINPFELHLGRYHSLIRRAMMLLLEYQISGGISGSVQRSVYVIPSEFENISNQYLLFLKSKKMLKDSTIKNNKKCLAQAFCFFIEHGITDLSKIDTEVMNLYLISFAGLSKSYISDVIRMLKRFFEFAMKEDPNIKTINFPSVSAYKDRKIPEYYSSEEIELILKSIDRANPLGKRDYAMILLAAKYGMRIGDIRKLKLSEIDFTNNTISIIQQKTDNPLKLPLLTDVGWVLIDYLKFGRPKSSSPFVFLRLVTPYEKLSDNDNMEYMIRKYANAAGIMKTGKHKKYSFHMLRYSLASELLENNVPLSTISEILGHSELNITSKYTQLNISQLRECALEVPK